MKKKIFKTWNPFYQSGRRVLSYRVTVWMQWANTSIRSASAAPIAANCSVIHPSSWRTVYPIVRRTGTSSSPPNVLLADFRWRQAIVGWKPWVTIITANVSIARYSLTPLLSFIYSESRLLLSIFTLFIYLQYCKQNLEGQSFYNKGGRPYCKNHAR